MWHKLREIFGYKDSRNRQIEATENKVVKTNENTEVPKEQSHMIEENVNSSAEKLVRGASNASLPQSDSEMSASTLTKIKDNWNEDCFECKVTVSVVTFCLMAHICNTLWKRRIMVPQKKWKYIALADLSLFGMWVAYMKNEWYDEKDTGNNTDVNKIDLSTFEIYKRR